MVTATSPTTANPAEGRWRRAHPVRSLVRDPFAVAVLSTAGGVLAASAVDVDGVTSSDAYTWVGGLLLAVGLYGSTYGIEVAEVRSNLRIVVPAVTVGVVLKATLIAVVLVALFGEVEYAVLGVAVAQIDPLSVAALRRSSRLSRQAKAILASWSSFDDPVTVLLTVYFAAFAVHAGGETVRGGLSEASPLGFGRQLAVNLAFAGAVLLLLRLVHRGPGRVGSAMGRLRRRGRPVGGSGLHQVPTALALAGLLLVAASRFLMLGISLIGLFFRPVAERLVDAAARIAYIVAGVALGLLLAEGIDPVVGITLGVVAFAANVVVSLLLTRGLGRDDRIGLALSQQNGITAMLLALVLQPTFDHTVAVVGPAIFTINVLHAATNAVWGHAKQTSVVPPAPPPQGKPPSGSPSAMAVMAAAAAAASAELPCKVSKASASNR